MNRTDAYVVLAVGAWIAGAFLISEGLKAQSAAIDRQTTAEYWCSFGYIAAYGYNENKEQVAEADCTTIGAEHRAKYR